MSLFDRAATKSATSCSRLVSGQASPATRR